jgi:methionine-rich copper-binding protein CopC
MIRTRLHAAAIATALTLAAVMGAMAHDEAKGPNGGQVADASGHHVEFVLAPEALTFFLSDETGKEIASAGAKAKALIQDAGKTTPLELSPAEPNKLTAKLDAPLSAGAKVVVTAVMADGHKVQARFVAP